MLWRKRFFCNPKWIIEVSNEQHALITSFTKKIQNRSGLLHELNYGGKLPVYEPAVWLSGRVFEIRRL